VFDGSVSPVFNLGPGSLKWKWAAAVKRGDLKEAGRMLKVTGVTAKGRKLAGLVRRRKEEALLITDGIYTGVTTGAVQKVIPDAMADGVLDAVKPVLQSQS
jgi:lysozyme